MTRAFACQARTGGGRGHYCRRPGSWSIQGDKRNYCRQHAASVARDRGQPGDLKHVLTGQVVHVTFKPLAIDRRPLPQGLDAIVNELNRARTRAAFNRCRRAIVAQIAELKDEHFGLRRPLIDAMHEARHRIGIPSTTGRVT